MDIFLNNRLPVLILLFFSVGAWLFGFVLSKIRKRGNPLALKILLCAISLVSNLILSVSILAWGGGLEHITAVFMLSLLVTLY